MPARRRPFDVLRRGVGRHRVGRDAVAARALRPRPRASSRRCPAERGRRSPARRSARTRRDRPAARCARGRGRRRRSPPCRRRSGRSGSMSLRFSISIAATTSRICVSRLDLGVAEMRALAEARIGRRPELMAGGAHQRAHLLPRPAGRPGAMRHHERRHSRAPRALALRDDIQSAATIERNHRERACLEHRRRSAPITSAACCARRQLLQARADHAAGPHRGGGIAAHRGCGDRAGRAACRRRSACRA